MSALPWLEAGDQFPDIDQALSDPNGLLAAGASLTSRQLIKAYSAGIFPWYEADQPVLWWSPDPRSVLVPDQLKISRSLTKRLKSNAFTVTLDTQFDKVISACAGPRTYSDGTWITTDMYNAYVKLHEQGYAHSIECSFEDELVGGLYGVSLGSLFFGESMFHHKTDASKVAMAYLCRLMSELNSPLIDCQIENDHLNSLGATNISRHEFRGYLNQYVDASHAINWSALPTTLSAW